MIAAIGLVVTACAPAQTAEAPKVVLEELTVPSDPGIEIYVRNKHLTSATTFRPDRTAVFVHGSTYPSETFDVQLDGLSWMDYMAARGYDVYALDIRGYGKSTKPKEMAEKAEANPPIVRNDVAIRDVSAVVDFVLKRRNIPRLDLVGWSSGTVLHATYASQNPSKVERLVLYAPLWVRPPGTPITPPSGAYRTVTREQAQTRWLNGVPEDKKAALIPAGWFDAWANVLWANDTVGAQQTPPVIRAPNGVLQDGAEFWQVGKAYYDPAKITAPTLLVGGEWDRDAPPALAQALFPLLVNSPGKRYVQLAEGTHTILMERNRMALFAAVQSFLDGN